MVIYVKSFVVCITAAFSSPQFDLDSIWTFIFGLPASSATVVGSIHSVYPEAAFLLLAMLRSMLNLVRTTALSVQRILSEPCDFHSHRIVDIPCFTRNIVELIDI